MTIQSIVYLFCLEFMTIYFAIKIQNVVVDSASTSRNHTSRVVSGTQ